MCELLLLTELICELHLFSYLMSEFRSLKYLTCEIDSLILLICELHFLTYLIYVLPLLTHVICELHYLLAQLEVCVLNEMCSNHDEIFQKKVGEPYICKFDHARWSAAAASLQQQ